MPDTEPPLQKIAEAYAATLDTSISMKCVDVALKTEILRWSLYDNSQGADWFVIQLSHNAHPTRKKPGLGLYGINLKASLLSPDGTRRADVFKHAPTATQPSVTHSEGVNFSLSGMIGVAGKDVGGTVSTGISFDNSNSVTYPGILVEDQTTSDAVDLTWRVADPPSTWDITGETMTFESTIIFMFKDSSEYGYQPSYNLNLQYTVLGAYEGATEAVGSKSAEPDTIATPTAPRE